MALTSAERKRRWRERHPEEAREMERRRNYLLKTQGESLRYARRKLERSIKNAEELNV